MTTQFRVAVRGNLEDWAREETKAAEIAVTNTVRSKTRSVRKAVQRQIRRAGFERRAFGASLESTIVGKTFPKRGRSINTAGRVESKAIYFRRTGSIDLIAIFSDGATVRGSPYLAIPTEAAPFATTRGAKRRARPGEVNIATGVFQVRPGLLAVYAKNRRRPDGKPLVMWWLVRNIRLNARLNPERELRRLTANIDELVARRWEREATKRGLDAIDF